MVDGFNRISVKLVANADLIVHFGSLLTHILVKLIFYEAGRGDQNTFDHFEVEMPQNALIDGFVKLRQAFFVLRSVALSLAWDVHVDFAPHQRHAGCDQADVRQSLLHDHSAEVRVLRHVAGHVHALQRYHVPFALRYFEFAIQFKIQRVVSAQLGLEIET